MTASCIHHWFETQVDRRPESIALRVGAHDFTYAHVEGKANSLARRLTGVARRKPRPLVGICAAPSPRAAVAILAALKAGASFAPIGVDGKPRSGISPDVILAEPRLAARAATGNVECIPLPDPLTYLPCDPGRPPSGAGLDDWACVLHARAGDADPRAVVLAHNDLVGAVACAHECLAVGENCTMLSLAAFDDPVFLLEMFVAFAAGARLRFVDNPLFLGKSAAADRETVLFANPGAVEEMLDASVLPANLRTLVLTEDLVSSELCGRLRDFAPGAALYNVLGQRETAGWTASRPLGANLSNVFADPSAASTRALAVLGPDLRRAPVGVDGDVYVTGSSLAQTFVDAAGLTAGPPRIDSATGAPLLSIGFVGRHEQKAGIQITADRRRRTWFRGRYVYPAEIETALRALPHVREAVVVVDRDLTAHLTADDEFAATALAACAPAGELPVKYVVSRAALPILADGTVDVAALRARRSERDPADEPSTPTQQALASIWAHVLAKERIGIRDNFFELGANSLEAYLACSRLAADLGVKLTIVDIYNHPTIQSLAAAIDRNASADVRGAARPVAANAAS